MEFGGSQVAALRRNSFADAAGSPRMTPRHSRNSSVEALANAAAFVQPYKARILYGGPRLRARQHSKALMHDTSYMQH